MPNRSSVKSLYIKLNIFPIQDIYKREIAKFMFNCSKTITPTLFHNYFEKVFKYQTKESDY